MTGCLKRKVWPLLDDTGDHNENLHQLLAISAHLENLTAQNSARFSAAEAYSAIVHQRISVLREERYEGRQTFFEFMMRRYDPAMRTCASGHYGADGPEGRAAIEVAKDR